MSWSGCIAPPRDSFPFKKETAARIAGIFNDPYRYAVPAVNPGSSRAHTYMRQVRAVVGELRGKLNRINEEIKSLLKLREGLARSLDELNAEIRAPTPEAMLTKPRFIKNRQEEAKADLPSRGLMTVKFSKPDSKVILRRLQEQYSVVKNQLQILGETRNSVTRAIAERDRVLDLLPYVTAATVRTRQLQAEEAAIAMQNEKDAALALAFANNERINRGATHRQIKKSDARSKLIPKANKIDLSAPLSRLNSGHKTTADDSIAVGRHGGQPSHSLPEALTEDCKAALKLASQTRGISRRTRENVRGIVSNCFTMRPGTSTQNEDVSRRQDGACLFPGM